MNEITPVPRGNGQLGPPGHPLPYPMHGSGGTQPLPPPDHDSEIVATANLRNSRRIATAVAVGAGIATGHGLFNLLAGENVLVRVVLSVVLSVILTFGLAGGWHMLLGTAARPVQNRPLLTFVVAAGIGLAALQVMTSSWFLASAISGGAAQRHHQSDTLEDLNRVASQIRARDERERVVLAHLTRAQSELERLRACEIEDGCISNTPGDGQVARDLGREIKTFQRGLRELKAGLDRRPALLAHVRAQIERAGQASRVGNEHAFTQAVNAVREGLSGADAADPALMLQALRSESDILEVQAVYERLRQSMDRVGEFEVALSLPSYAPMNRATAVLHYADRVPFGWIVAVAIDCIPLALLLLLLLASHRPPVSPQQPVYDYDYAELELARIRKALEEEAEVEAVDDDEADEEPAPRPQRRKRRSG